MYFSLITPAEGRERDAAHEWTREPYAEHQWLWRLFAAPPGTPRDFLFRRSETGGLPRFHVVSRRVPQPAGTAWCIQTRPYEPCLAQGDRLQFELRANPSVRHGRDGKSKRHDVVMEAKKRTLAESGLSRWSERPNEHKPALYALVQQSCTHWLAQRGARLGFEFDEQRLVAEAYQQHGDKTGRKLQYSSVDLSGELTVTDPKAFTTALYEGVGHAKAFGCGLLLVRQAR